MNIIKRQLKPIVFDNKNFLNNLNNWCLKDSEWGGFEYEGGEKSQYYEFSIDWEVNGQSITTLVEVYHTWVEAIDNGDYDTPSSSEVVHEESNTYVIQIYNNDTDVEYDLDGEYHDMARRLSYLIEDKVVN